MEVGEGVGAMALTAEPSHSLRDSTEATADKAVGPPGSS